MVDASEELKRGRESFATRAWMGETTPRLSMQASTFIKSDGATLSYTVLGGAAGERTLVCHPGGPGMSGSYFGDLCGLGSERRRVVLFNPRGTGGSSRPVDGRYELEDYAADVDALRAHLELEGIDLLGHSHGGFVAMVYALSYPGRLGRLVLACTVARFGAELSQEASAAFAVHSERPWFQGAIEAQSRRQAWAFSSREELAALYSDEARLWFADDAAARAFLPAFARAPGPPGSSLLQHPARRGLRHAPTPSGDPGAHLDPERRRGLLRPPGLGARAERDPRLARDAHSRRGPLPLRRGPGAIPSGAAGIPGGLGRTGGPALALIGGVRP